MAEWWRISYERRMRERSLLMSLLRITVYGSFWPPEQKERLEEICTHLRNHGFVDSDIVEGEKRPNEWRYDSFQLSIFYLEESDANFLFFTREGARIGLTTECTYLLTSSSMCKRWSTCVIFNQTENGRDSLGQLNKDRLLELNEQRIRIPVVDFESWEEGRDAAYHHAADFLKALGPVLRARANL